MKKSTVFIVLFLITNCYVFAQGNYTPFPEDSAQWSIWQYNWDSSGNYLGIVSYQLKMRGDTNINGVDYNKIYKGYDLNYSSTTDSLHCFIRQDTAQRKVWVRYPYYMYNDSSELLLYDFSLNIGDTVTFKLIGSGIYYMMKLMSIVDSVQLNNNLYISEFNFQWVMPPTGGVWGGACNSCNVWGEVIGNGCSLLYNEVSEGYCNYHDFSLQCFLYNGIYYQGGNFCDMNTSVGSNNNNEILLEITPNPANENLKIQFYNVAIKRIELIDVYGNKIKTIETGNVSNLIFNTNNIQPGFYCLIGYGLNGKVYKEKFCIVH